MKCTNENLVERVKQDVCLDSLKNSARVPH